MYCTKCGSQISDEAVICIHCGVPTQPQTRTEPVSNPLALIGFILSFFLSIPALVCSSIAYRRCKDDPNVQGKGMALAGLIISAIEIGAAALACLVCLIIWAIIYSSIGLYGM